MDQEEDEILDSYDDDSDSNDKEYDIIDNDHEVKANTEDILTFMKNYEQNKKQYKTSNVLSKYEKTRVLSERAQQLEDGSHPYIPNVERFTTSYGVALEEFNTRKIPYIIRRSMPHSNNFEYWKLKDMIF